MANHDDTTVEPLDDLEKHIEAIKMRNMVALSIANRAQELLAGIRAESARKDSRIAELEAEVERLRAVITKGSDPDGEHGDHEEDE